MNIITPLLRRGRVALLEFGPLVELLMLPGGYLLALSELIHRCWPLGSGTAR